MSIERSEMRRLLAEDFGRQFKTQSEAVAIEAHRNEGAFGALGQLAESLESVKKHWVAQRDEEKIEPETLVSVLKAIDQCQGCARNLREKAEAQRLLKLGESQGLEKALATMRKAFEAETARMEALVQAATTGQGVTPEPGRPALRVIGTHPGSSIAAQRKIEEAAETLAQRGQSEKIEQTAENAPESTPDTGSGSSPAPIPENAVVPVARKRRRPPR